MLRAWSACFLAAAVLAAGISPACAQKGETAPKATVVFRIDGVLSKRSGKGKKTKRVLLPAFVQTALKPGDEVRTHARSRAEIRLGDGVLVRLKENTVFKLERLKSRKGTLNVALRLLKGKILLKVGKLGSGSRVRVRTPTAVAGVRGTMFVVDAQAAKTEIKVLEGTVRAAAVSGTAPDAEDSAGKDVSAGQEVAAVEGQPLSEPEPMSAEETAQETGWAQEAEIAAPEAVVGEEPGSPETEPVSEPVTDDEQSPEVVEPESAPTENPEVQQDQPPEPATPEE